MLIIPAIDLKDGCVVRYVQGAHDKKVYSKDPLKVARHWVKQGAKMIHIVDLDGAMTGIQKNLAMAEEIVKAIGVPVQFGGGVRDIQTLKRMINSGVARVVLGTRAVQDSSFLKKCFQGFKNKVIVSVDTRDSKIMTKGWQESEKGADVLEFVLQLKRIGFKEMIYTDVTKDGTLKGPNVKDLKKLLKETGMKIIASGGISTLADISRLKLMEKQGLSGIIVGKALYEGKFTLAEARKLA